MTPIRTRRDCSCRASLPEAEKLCQRVLAEQPDHFQAALLAGRIALLGNRLDEARKLLERGGKLKHEDKAAAAFLAEVFYRRDDFQQASAWLRKAGKDAMAAQLESFKDRIPYQITGQRTAHVKFIHTDPLPLVSVAVNGQEVNFLIDTGASEVILDSDLAKKAGISVFGEEARSF